MDNTVVPCFFDSQCIYTLSQKNVPPLNCYNLDIHDQITITFGKSVTKKVKNQRMLCFPTSPI